jgi:hypothetical protein
MPSSQRNNEEAECGCRVLEVSLRWSRWRDGDYSVRCAEIGSGGSQNSWRLHVRAAITCSAPRSPDRVPRKVHKIQIQPPQPPSPNRPPPQTAPTWRRVAAAQPLTLPASHRVRRSIDRALSRKPGYKQRWSALLGCRCAGSGVPVLECPDLDSARRAPDGRPQRERGCDH